MLELCQVIDVDGKPVSKKNPDIKMIYFGELFNVRILSFRPTCRVFC